MYVTSVLDYVQFMVTLFKTLAVLALSIFSSFMYSALLSTYWGWFVIPHFPSAPHLSTTDMWGLTYVFGLLTSGMLTVLSSKFDNAKDILSTAITLYLSSILFVYPISWLSAFIFHCITR